jgi:hypothetical protein
MTTTAPTTGAALPSRALAALRSSRQRISAGRFAASPSRGPAARKGTADGTDGAARLKRLIGGKRGVIDGALPPLVFVVTNAIATPRAPRPTPLALALGAALGTAGVIVVLRLVRKQTLKQALGGLAGLAVAVIFALRAGEARAFFLPGIYVDAVYALAFASSALAGRPLVAIIYRWLYGGRAQRGEAARLLRAFTVTTIGWSLIYASRVAVQAALYQADRPGIMAASKIAMGWPLTIVAVALSLAYLQRACSDR